MKSGAGADRLEDGLFPTSRGPSSTGRSNPLLPLGARGHHGPCTLPAVWRRHDGRRMDRLTRLLLCVPAGRHPLATAPPLALRPDYSRQPAVAVPGLPGVRAHLEQPSPRTIARAPQPRGGGRRRRMGASADRLSRRDGRRSAWWLGLPLRNRPGLTSRFSRRFRVALVVLDQCLRPLSVARGSRHCDRRRSVTAVTDGGRAPL